MNFLDVLILVLGALYGFGGFRNGAVVGALSLLGFFVGAVVGAQLASPIGSWLANGRSQVLIAIICVLVLALLGQFLGVWAASQIKARYLRNRAGLVDSGIGAVFGVASVLLVAWMVAVPLASSPYPTLSTEATGSTIVRGVNDVMPNGVRSLYSSLRGYLDRSGFPPVFGDLPSTPLASVPAPTQHLAPDVRREVAAARQSTFKILGQAPSCQRSIEGSGFVFAPHRILTNAHVVAGTDQVAVQSAAGGHALSATVVLYDPSRDIAVLQVPGLNAPVLRLAGSPADRGDPAVVLGYPEDGPFTVASARISARETVSGANIYGDGSVDREVYVLRAMVRSGNSGGPLLSDDGSVLGVVFATARNSSDTGYALSAAEVQPDATTGRSATAAVETGDCTPD